MTECKYCNKKVRNIIKHNKSKIHLFNKERPKNFVKHGASWNMLTWKLSKAMTNDETHVDENLL